MSAACWTSTGRCRWRRHPSETIRLNRLRPLLALTQAVAEEFLSHPDYRPFEGDAESPSDLLEDIAGVVDATAEDEDIS